MSAIGFQSKGGPGAAPVTVYFGAVPDRLSVMGQGNYNTSTGLNANSGSPANLVSLWTLYNTNMSGGANVVTASFGSSASAPDGTTNGIKLIESATNTIHACESTFITNQKSGGYLIRASVFAKAAERTRFALYVGTGVFDQNNGGVVGCKTVFDLAGGRIGVANTAFGSPTTLFVPGPTEIANFGSGWYRCTMDVTMGSNDTVGLNYPGYMFGILLDSGSGVGAESTSYSGNGTSGALFWKSTSLPPAAWGLNTVSFFDDFTSLSTVDTGDTRAAGFNWYIHAVWPNLPGNSPNSGSLYSISSPSVLKIASGGVFPQVDYVLQSAASNGNTNFPLSNTYVGRVFQPPMLIESFVSWDQGPAAPATNTGGNISHWTFSLNELVEQPQLNQCEHDFFEFTTNTAQGYLTSSILTGSSGITVQSGCESYPIWYANVNYHDNIASPSRAADGQQLYNSLVVGNLNNVPHLTVGVDWSTFSLTGYNIPYANQNYFDWNQKFTVSNLWLSSVGNDVGHNLTFFNGRYCGPTNNGMIGSAPGHVTWSFASGGLSAIAAQGDRLYYPIQVGSTVNLNQFIDWIKVTQ